MFASSSFLLEEWLLRSTLAGGLLLLAGAAIMGCIAQPARRQRVGELALLSSLAVTCSRGCSTGAGQSGTE